MRALFVGSCAKEPDLPEANEDAYAFSADRSRFVVSDGASESYDSSAWARQLVDRYAIDPAFDERWLEQAMAQYAAGHDVASLAWAQQLAFERGCFATLLAADHDEESKHLMLFGVGDSVALLLDAGVLTLAWPLSEPEQFRERPTLVSTLREHNQFVREESFAQQGWRKIDLAFHADPVLLCMTDALGEWAVRAAKESAENLTRLASIATYEDLLELVVSERAAKRMRVDDSTLAILRFDGLEGGDGLSQP